MKARKLAPEAAKIAQAGRQNIYLATFTVRRDLDDPLAYEPDAIRRRAVAIAAGVKAVRAFVGRVDREMGLHVAPDVGVQGGYHMHGLLASTRFDWGKAQAAYRKALGRRNFDGNIDFRVVHAAGAVVTGDKIADAVAEVTKYPGKCPARWRKVQVREADVDPATGEVLADERVGVQGGEGEAIDPELAARHEIGLYALCLNRWYGSFRNLKVPEVGPALNSDEALGMDGANGDGAWHNCPCGSEQSPQLVRYGVHDYDSSRCVPDVPLDDRLDRAQIAACWLQRVAGRWGASVEDVRCWVDERTRRVRGVLWIRVDRRLREDFEEWRAGSSGLEEVG